MKIKVQISTSAFTDTQVLWVLLITIGRNGNFGSQIGFCYRSGMCLLSLGNSKIHDTLIDPLWSYPSTPPNYTLMNVLSTYLFTCFCHIYKTYTEIVVVYFNSVLLYFLYKIVCILLHKLEFCGCFLK